MWLRGAAAGLDERLEDSGVDGVLVAQAFGVELHADEPGEDVVVGMGFEGFDHAVGAACSDAQGWGDPADRLMMRAVNAERSISGDLGELGTGFRGDFMDALKPFGLAIVREGFGSFQGDVRDEIASEGDIENLLAATDREEGFGLAEGFVDENQFEEIAMAFCWDDGAGDVGVEIRAVQGRMHVFTSREHDPMAMADGFADDGDVGGAGKDQGQGAGGDQGVGVALGEADGGVGEFGALPLGVGGDENPGA